MKRNNQLHLKSQRGHHRNEEINWCPEKTSPGQDLSICPTRGRRVVATDRYQADGSLTVSTNLIKQQFCLGTASNILQQQNRQKNYFEFQLLPIRLDMLTWLLGKQQKSASNTEGKECHKPRWWIKEISRHCEDRCINQSGKQDTCMFQCHCKK